MRADVVINVIATLMAGMVFGLSAGLSPGPLLALVIAQTLRHGIKEGVKVAFSPFVTDVPIILIVILVLTRLANSHVVLGSISLIGGLFVLYLAFESFRTSALDVNGPSAEPQSLRQGALANALNPHPYLFWLTVGAPTMITAWTSSALAAVAFVGGFYMCLVGSKVSVAIVAGKSRQWLTGKVYLYLMRALGVLLVIFALRLFWDGLTLIGLLRQ